MDFPRLFSNLIRFETELWASVDEKLRSAHNLALSWFEPMQIIDRIGGCRVNDIAETLSITVGGTSKLVDRIEAAGWCRRKPNPEDSRSSQIELTEAGRNLLAEATTTFVRELEIHFGLCLAHDTLEQFAASIEQLRKGLQTPGRKRRGRSDSLQELSGT